MPKGFLPTTVMGWLQIRVGLPSGWERHTELGQIPPEPKTQDHAGNWVGGQLLRPDGLMGLSESQAGKLERGEPLFYRMERPHWGLPMVIHSALGQAGILRQQGTQRTRRWKLLLCSVKAPATTLSRSGCRTLTRLVWWSCSEGVLICKWGRDP